MLENFNGFNGSVIPDLVRNLHDLLLQHLLRRRPYHMLVFWVLLIIHLSLLSCRILKWL